MTQLDGYLNDHRGAFQEELASLLRIASVSADSRFRPQVQAAAEWVRDRLLAAGIETQLFPTAGHPIVYGEWLGAPGKPTVLVYGHYDVQPPDPLGEWITPPFEPTIRGGNIYARGATDDKGQMLTHVLSAAATLAATGRLPVNLKFLIEGEEEVGSEHLGPFIDAQRERLSCDCVVISDTSQFAAGQPAITYGLRGIAYYELRLTGPKQDLHSGTFGGAVINPANTLNRMLAALMDDRGRVTIPGFYDEVEPLSERERREFASLGFSESDFARQIGVAGLGGEEGYTALERRWARPTYDVHGLWSGYQGEGAKTVLPAKAGAKFSFRLVPRQDPGKITAALRTMFERLLPAGVTMELLDFHGAPGVTVPLDSPYMAAASRAIERSFGRRPVMIREGGSIPVVGTFKQLLDVDTLLLGWGRDDDNMHSPNEKFSLDDFHHGIRASAYLWEELASGAS